MPAKSEKQRRLMGAALAYKRGDYEDASEEIIRVANSMSEEELEKMASKPIAKPTKKEKQK